MDRIATKPGPDASRAFRLGMLTATVVPLAGIVLLFRYGIVSSFHAAFTVVVFSPAYLVFVASVLSVWLGFDKDVSDLRPVYQDHGDDG